MCGENSFSAGVSGGCKGSPPRVRGKRYLPKSSAFRAGITPACAGKTLAELFVCIPVEDHPRVCGENDRVRRVIRVGEGSPPRVRGKRAALNSRKKLRRITPACAGKTRSVCVPDRIREDHPRVCGENVLSICPPYSGIGSPPRVRGKQLSCKA